MKEFLSVPPAGDEALAKAEKLGRSNPESIEKKRTGETLETLFQHEERIIDQETLERLEARDLSDFLVSGEPYPFSGEREYGDDALKEKRKQSHEIFTMLSEAPESPEIIRLRQEIIQAMLVAEKQSGVGTKKKEGFVESLRAAVGALYDVMPPPLFGFPGNEGEMEEDYARLQSYLKKSAQIPKVVQTLEELFARMNTTSPLIAEFKASVARFIPISKAYAEQVKTSTLMKEFPALIKYGKSMGDKNLLKDCTIKNEKQYRAEAQKISVRSFTGGWNDKELETLGWQLANMERLLLLTEVVRDRELKPVEIVGESVIDLKQARHPFVLRDKGGKKTVPVDIALNREKPTLAMTGDNMTGKSKFAETIPLNGLLIQATGHGFVDGGRYSPRKEILFLQALPGSGVEETQSSRGDREMKELVKIVGQLEDGNLVILDEVLTSTDSQGALAIVLAILERNADKGGVNVMALHSRLLEKVRKKNLSPTVRCLRAVLGPKGEKMYKWEEGVGTADPIALARSHGMPDDILKRAEEIARAIEE